MLKIVQGSLHSQPFTQVVLSFGYRK